MGMEINMEKSQTSVGNNLTSFNATHKQTTLLTQIMRTLGCGWGRRRCIYGKVRIQYFAR